ncbi:MAG: DUF2029 domain-containing protein [Gemmatimonadaceae bacterium]|nr:DUF2029 domain-containing protein [Gemmatimonadaceae bacterium]
MRGNYGPVFQALSEAVASASFGYPLLGLATFKLISLCALWGTAWTVQKTVTEAGGPPDTTARLLFCNPLILFNFVTAAHNDAIFLVPVGLALVVWRRRPVVAGMLLGVSISLKLFAAFLLPVRVIATWRRMENRSTRQAIGLLLGALCGLTIGLLPDFRAADYLLGWVRNDLDVVRSTIHLAIGPMMAAWSPLENLDSLAVGRIVFLLLAPWMLYRHHRRFERNDPQFLIAAAFDVMLLMQVLVLHMMNEWYLLWPMVFAVARGRDMPRDWWLHVSVLVMPIAIWAVIGHAFVVIVAQALLVVVYTAAAVGHWMSQTRSRNWRYALTAGTTGEWPNTSRELD